MIAALKIIGLAALIIIGAVAIYAISGPEARKVELELDEAVAEDLIEGAII